MTYPMARRDQGTRSVEALCHQSWGPWGVRGVDAGFDDGGDSPTERDLDPVDGGVGYGSLVGIFTQRLQGSMTDELSRVVEELGAEVARAR